MRTVDVRSHWLSVAVLAVTAMTSARAAAQADDAPVGLPAHEMLEDPFNRSVVLDELELRDGDELHWDASAWLGYSFDRLAIRTEGERDDGNTERAELQLLWSHAFARWWELLAGARADFAPGASRNWAAFGVQGLAPYRVEIEATAFVGEGGDTAARLESHRDFAVTPRLLLRSHLDVNWHGRADAARGLGSGLSSVEAGLRLRYEVRREVAPYVGLVRERRMGGTADLARAAGRDADDTSFVAGIRVRF